MIQTQERGLLCNARMRQEKILRAQPSRSGRIHQHTQGFGRGDDPQQALACGELAQSLLIRRAGEATIDHRMIDVCASLGQRVRQ